MVGAPQQERRSRRRSARRALRARASAGRQARTAQDLRPHARPRSSCPRRAVGLPAGKRGSKTGIAASGARRRYRRPPGRTWLFQARGRRARARRRHMSSSNMPATHNPTTPQDWWSTAIIDMKPGMIRYRGYAIEELIGRISFDEMVYLMTRGELPDPAAAKLLEAALVAAVDHGPQAPSIAAARMAITCGVGINNAMASAINMLGDVHGGAGEQCVRVYNAVHDRAGEHPPSDRRLGEAVAAEIKALADAGTRHVPGFGHRFHPRDPRAPRLLELVDAAAASGAVSGRFGDLRRAVAGQLAA